MKLNKITKTIISLVISMSTMEAVASVSIITIPRDFADQKTSASTARFEQVIESTNHEDYLGRARKSFAKAAGSGATKKKRNTVIVSDFNNL